MLVHRTIEKNAFWDFDCIIMKNMSHNLLLFCGPTWVSHHVIENHLFSSGSCTLYIASSLSASLESLEVLARPDYKIKDHNTNKIVHNQCINAE